MALMCVDQEGALQLNTFGKNSFAAKEAFDTLIPCAQCMSPESMTAKNDPEEAILSKQSEVLQDEVNQLKAKDNAQDTKIEKLESDVKALKGTTNFVASTGKFHLRRASRARHIKKAPKR